MDNTTIHKQLLALAEPEFQRFSSALLPGVDNLLGVRLPILRKMAKKLAAGDWRSYLDQAADDSFEEVMLQGMVIGYIQTTVGEWLERIVRFLPKINNWSVCDSFCSSLKQTREHPEEMWRFLMPCLTDSREFTVRFGVVMLLFYYIDDTHIRQVLTLLEQVEHPGYYVRMAVAWAVSICYVKLPEQTESFLLENRLEDATFNKAIQKIVESRCVDRETKDRLRKLKRALS
jgi:3-methyladenine DNA glycosylase AlkD